MTDDECLGILEAVSPPSPPPVASAISPETKQTRIPVLNDDILRCIIEFAVSPRSEDAFIYEPGTTQDILALIHVSWRLLEFTRPFLYQRVHLTSKRQVDLLVKRNPPANLPIRDLTIEGSALEHHDLWPLIRDVGGTLERFLIIDNTMGFDILGQCPYTYLEFKTRFPRLWETSNTFKYPYLFDISGVDRPVPVPVPELPHLKRQALLRLGHVHFTDCWTSLEVLATVSNSSLDASLLAVLIESHPRLRELILVLTPERRLMLRSNNVVRAKREFAVKYRGRCVFYDVDSGLTRSSMMETWFAEAIRRGTLWTMKRKNWLSYQ
ncbi:hypothetical protein DACRYDRAFT_118737 [Dacryopinax primogenitus]|uniref:Uncharacterized protein n=1 Tax=Dacryopinax primogenitus (strain DJM 731) TaxID=1858805 RepID=M5FT05_DACPD|nr:uncharacterized protein DACRYDRAFT_118737 [Dacryopinax primogenitus]EJT98474.1 hypothetical protein DACRYDRAFT_118737 [Dacryopinax primogenitus]